jgi:predicted amidohydrolase YtcJ
MAAARTRRTRHGRDVGRPERIGADAALALFLGSATRPARPRVVKVGAPADLCLLAVDARTVRHEPDAAAVRATIVAGDVVHQR